MGVCLCVCQPPRNIASDVMWDDMVSIYIWLNKFYSCYMAAVAILVVIDDGRALRVEVCCRINLIRVLVRYLYKPLLSL